MANTKIANSEAISACDSVVDAIDGGAGAGVLRIFGGTQPTNADDTHSETVLAELTLSDPAFGNATDADPGATATANAISDDTSANNSGTATWFRAHISSAAATDGGVIDGDVSATGGGGDLELDSTSISSGATVSVTSWTVTMPES